MNTEANCIIYAKVTKALRCKPLHKINTIEMLNASDRYYWLKRYVRSGDVLPIGPGSVCFSMTGNVNVCSGKSGNVNVFSGFR